MQSLSSKYAMLAEFLTALEADGNQQGTDQYQRIQELLRRLPEDTRAEDLRTMLAPILCKDKDEQEHFYAMFDRSLKQVQAVEAARQEQTRQEGSSAQSRPAGRRAWWVWVVVTVGLVTVLGVLLFNNIENSKAPEQVRLTKTISVGQVADLVCFDTMYAGKKIERFELMESGLLRPMKSRSFDPFKWPINSDSACVTCYPDTSNHCLTCRGLKPGMSIAQMRIGLANGRLYLTNVTIQVLDTSRVDNVQIILDTAVFVERVLPHQRDLAALSPPQPTGFQKFLQNFEWPLKVLAILLSALLFGRLARWIERRRRKLIAEHTPNNKPPYSWNIHLGEEPEITQSERFYNVLHQLRQREQDEWRRLNMPKTVQATIANAGMPSFQFSHMTRPAEYLLLLDRQSARNHRAELFNCMYKSFRQQEILVQRYFFDGDPRLCWNEANPAGINIRDLLYRYPQARLLIVSDGYSLLNPQTGRLAKWSKLFTAWKDRAVLSPQPLSIWGRRERAIQEQFLLFPAALSGLQAAIQVLDSEEGQVPEMTQRNFPDATWEPIQFQPGGLIATLEHYFDKPQAEGAFKSPASAKASADKQNFQAWIAACAVYPELHWDITIFLGQLLSTEENPLLSYENIARLCRLPWFSAGEIPTEARKVLLTWLEQQQPDTLLRVRTALHTLLLKNPPPRDSAAYDDFAMNMALNEWLITKDKKRKQELEKEIAARMAAGQQADFTVVKVLERPRSPLDFVVPNSWKKYLYLKGSPLLGLKAWVWLLPVWLVLSGILLAWKPSVVTCHGATANYQNQDWCLETGEELVQFWEMQAMNTLATGDTLAADSITKNILLTGWKNWQLTQDPLNTQLQFRYMPILFDTSSSVLSARELSFEGLHAEILILSSAHSISRKKPELPEGANPWIDSIACLQNLAVAYFNQGVRIRDSLKRNEVNKQDPDEAACLFFQKAEMLNTMLPDTARLWYVQVAAKQCRPRVPASETVQATPTNVQNQSSANTEPGRRITKLEVGDIVKQICNAVGIAQNFEIRSADVKNAMSAIIEGKRYLLYNDQYIQNIGFNDGVRRWGVYLVFAHEIGHMVLDHDLTETIGTKRKQFELEADRFAGWVLHRLGASLDEVKSAFQMALPNSHEETSTHPPTSARLEATAVGWKSSDEQMRILTSERVDATLWANNDKDDDGVPDAEDKCPDEKGEIRYSGCPDGDGDGIPDNEDSCPTISGIKDNYGCPTRPAPNGGDFLIYKNFDDLEKRIQNESGILVLNFWATWAKPPVDELPYFEKLNSSYVNKGVKILLVSLDFQSQLERRLFPFLRSNTLKSEVVLLADQDADTWIPKINPDWDGAIPVTILINNKNGQKAFWPNKFDSYEALDEFLKKFMDNK